jgi:hypothetical protein
VVKKRFRLSACNEWSNGSINKVGEAVIDLQNSPERGLTGDGVYAETRKMAISGSIGKLFHHFRSAFRVLQVAPVTDKDRISVWGLGCG